VANPSGGNRDPIRVLIADSDQTQSQLSGAGQSGLRSIAVVLVLGAVNGEHPIQEISYPL
jgi:hypothetical protein